MAGDWSKAQHGLRNKPEVISMASVLRADRDLIVGKLLVVWEWFDQNTTDGNAPGVTPAFLNEHVALDGFASALESVGWLSIRTTGISMPNFDRHCSKSAKERALANVRMRRSRYVSGATKPQPEKRREEKSKATPIPPSIEEVEAYCLERKNGISPQAFLDHYEAAGWVRSRGVKITDWKACIRTWERSEFRKASNGQTKPRLPDPEEDAAWMP